MAGSDAQSRRNILQGLQQTRSRLQKQHSEDPHKVTLPHMRGVAGGGHTHSLQRPSPTYSAQQQMVPKTPLHLTGSSPMSHLGIEHAMLVQQQKMTMQVTSQSYGYFISQPSNHSNLVIPVLPRFDPSGQLVVPHGSAS